MSSFFHDIEYLDCIYLLINVHVFIWWASRNMYLALFAGIAVMMWNTFIVKRLSAAAYLMDKVKMGPNWIIYTMFNILINAYSMECTRYCWYCLQECHPETYTLPRGKRFWMFTLPKPFALFISYQATRLQPSLR